MNKMITTVIGFGSTMAVGLGFQPLNFSLKHDTYNPPRTNVIVKEAQDNKEHSAAMSTFLTTNTTIDTTVKENDAEKNKEKVQVVLQQESPASSTNSETAEQQPENENVQQDQQLTSPGQETPQAEKERPNMHASEVAKQAVEKEHAPEGQKKDKEEKPINVQVKDIVEVTVQLL